MSVMLFDLTEEGNFERLAALGFLLLASTLIIVGDRPPAARARFHAAAGAGMSKLVLRGSGKSFGTVAAVAGCQSDLQAGEFVSLLGPSGCGKTTTLRMIAGFIEPDRRHDRDGRRGAVVARRLVPPERRGMSMIFQSYAIWPNMTVAQNVAFGLKLRRLPREELRSAARRMLEVVQLGHLADRYPAELSGGQQQRVALARAIVIEPEVLLLDEPLSNLDANLREEMRSEIRRLHDGSASPRSTSRTIRPRRW